MSECNYPSEASESKCRLPLFKEIFSYSLAQHNFVGNLGWVWSSTVFYFGNNCMDGPLFNLLKNNFYVERRLSQTAVANISHSWKRVNDQ